MGEIAEALKRAREADRSSEPAEPRRRSGLPPAPAPRPAPEPAEAVAIDDQSSEGWEARTAVVQPEGVAASHFRHLALRLARTVEAQGIRSLLITSSSQGEGKTTVSCNLVLALASLRSEGRIALVDFDVRRPAAAKALGVEVEHGISEVIEGKIPLQAACLQAKGVPLDLYLTRDAHPDPVKLISSSATHQLLADLRRRYVLTIIDTPPVLPVPDVPLLEPHVDATLLVVSAGTARRRAFEETIATLGSERVAGVFLNRSGSKLANHYYAYYRRGEQPGPEPEASPDG